MCSFFGERVIIMPPFEYREGTLMSLLAASPTVGNPGLNLTIFAGFVLATFAIMIATARGGRATTDYYTGGQGFTGAQNGIAIAGDYLSAAAFLGVVGAVAVYGYDGVMFAIGSLTGWVIALLFVAEPLRNTGRYTMADVLSYRLRVRPVRAAAATSTLLVSMLYLVAQIAGAGGLVSLLVGIGNSDRFSQSVVIGGVGVLMLVYVLVGGMKGTTWVQILKAALLVVAGASLAVWVLGRWGFNLSSLLGSTMQANPGAGAALLQPGPQYGQTGLSKLDFLSLGLAGLLGPASLPHVLMRFYTVPDGRAARRSAVWAIWLIGGFFLAAIVIGYGAAALVGPEAITAAAGESNAAAPLLAYELGGEILLGVVAAVAFATILAVVAGLTITASASFAHDVYAGVLKGGHAEPRKEVRVARGTAVVVGIAAIAGGIVANGQNIAVLVGLTFAVAASAHLPSLLYTLYWPRFTTTGAVLSIWGGMIIALGLVAFSPEVSGRPTSLFPDVDFAWFPFANPGMVSIPASFLLGAVGTWCSRRPDRDARRRQAEMEVRALTGASADRATRRRSPVAAVRRHRV